MVDDDARHIEGMFEVFCFINCNRKKKNSINNTVETRGHSNSKCS